MLPQTASHREPTRKQHDFLQLIAMSSHVSSRSQACNTHPSLDKLGAINTMSSALSIIYELESESHNLLQLSQVER